MVPTWEGLESRQLLSTTDYVLSGDAWANPSQITYSFPADGTPWDGGYNNLTASLNAQFGGGAWVRDLAEALQTWASVANINVVMTADGSQPFNSAGLSQGDPRFGDIRFGGYNFDSSFVLAQSYNPPPNGLTGAGDVEVNTGFDWAPGQAYDLYSVMLHETGLALGMGETTDPTAVMNRTYGGTRAFLELVDIAGIQAIYGPRLPDAYQWSGQASSFDTAADLTSGLVPLGAGQQSVIVGGTSLCRIGDSEVFSVVAPAGSGAETLAALANPMGISSLSPQVTIYDSSFHALATAGNAASWGDAVTANAGGIVPGQRYYVVVSGATSDVFSVGAYNLQISFGGINSGANSGGSTGVPTPVPPPPPPPPAPVATNPNTTATNLPLGPGPTVATEPPPVPLDRFEPNNDIGHAADLGPITSTVVTGLTIASPGDVQFFTFVPTQAGTVTVSTGSTKVWAFDASGRQLASGTGSISFANAAAGTRFWVAVGSADGKVNPGFAMALNVVPPSQQVVEAPTVAAAPTAPVAPTPVAPTPAATSATQPSTGHVRVAVERPRGHHRVAVIHGHWARRR